MKKNRIAISTLLCAMFLSNVGFTQDFSDFDALKSAIESATGESATNLTFSSEMNFVPNDTKGYNYEGLSIGNNKNITITGSGSAAFKGNSRVGMYDTLFNVETGGTLKLEHLTIKDFGSEQTSGAITNSGNLTIGPGVTFTNNKSNNLGGRPAPIGGGIITNSGNLTLESADGGNISFDKVTKSDGTTQADIFMQGGVLTIKGVGGTVTINNGITSNGSAGSITKEGNNEFILAGDSSKYKGTFTQTAGTTTFKGEHYFGGSSNINGGTFNWEASDDTTRGKLSFGAGSILNVGNSSPGTSSVLTLDGSKGDSISDTVTMTVNGGSTLNLNNLTTTLKKKIDGTGTLSLSSDNITFDGDDAGFKNEGEDHLTLKANNSTLTLSNMTNDTTTLTTIAQATNSGTEINLENYKGTDTAGLDVDGTKIKELNFSGENTYTLGGLVQSLKVSADESAAGTITNKNGANTTIRGSLEIGETGKTYTKNPTLVNEDGATLEIDGGSTGLTNTGKVDNQGILKANSIGNDGTFENSGTLTTDRLINGQNDSSAVFNSTADNFTVNETVSNYAQITGVNATFGTYIGSGSSDQLTLTGDLTITGEDGEPGLLGDAISNDGTITAHNIDVKQGGVTNNGNITASGTLTVKDKFTNTTGTVSAAGGSLGEVEMTSGTLKNTEGGKLTIGGAVTGSNGSIENNGDLTLTGDGSGFTGTFTQKDGSTTVNSGGGKLFGGTKTIEKGTLTVTAETMDWTGAVQLASDTEFNFTGTGESTITNELLSFTGSGADANFTGGSYSIADKFSGTGNNLNFNNATVTLKGESTDYTNSGNITLNNNSTLNASDKETKHYTFGSFSSSNSTVDFDVKIKNDDEKVGTGYLETDTFKFNSGSGVLSVGKLYIDGNGAERGQTQYDTKQNVLQGNFNFNNRGILKGDDKITWGSNKFVYDVYVKEQTISLENGRAANSKTLNDMNILSGERQFMTDGEYEIEEDLQATESGIFRVFGKNKDNSKDSLKGNNHRFFNIGEDKDTELHIDDLTITGASSDDGGSVLQNKSADSKVFIKNSDIKGNTSTGGKGGAIYNNGGSGTDPTKPDEFTGLYVGNTTFENNTATGKGGAIYNDEKGFLYLENVTTAEATGEGQNDIYNAGTAYTNGENTFGSLFTNDGEVTFQGTKDALSAFETNGGTANFNSANATLGTVTGDDGSSITNSGNLTLKGSGASYAGAFSQTAGTFTVDSSSTFFGGSSTVSGGVLNWYTKNQPDTSKLTLSGETTTLNVGDATDHTGTINFGTDSSISEDVTTNIYDGSTLNVKGGDVTLSKGLWQGDVSLESGNLTLSNLNNITSGGTLKATEGNLTLTGTTKLALDEDSSIEEKVVTNIGKESEVYLNQGSLTLDSLDTWEGAVLMAGESTGKLTFDGYDGVSKGMGILAAFGGEVDILNKSNITLGGDNRGIIGDFVQATIDETSSVTLLKEGILVLDDADTWQGTVNLNGGELDYGMTKMDETAKLVATEGNLNLMSGSILEIGKESKVDNKVSVDIQSGSTVDIKEGGKFNITGYDEETATGDKWNGLVKNEGGEFTATGIVNKGTGSGQFQQDSGKATFQGKSDIVIVGDSYITGGDISIWDASSLAFASGNDLNFNNLDMKGTSTFNILNGIGQNVNVSENFTIDGSNNFALDVDLRGGTSDKFTFADITGESGGNINVSDFGFVGGAPVYRNVELQLFETAGEIPENVTFSATNKQVMTPIGEYGLTSLGAGRYLASLGRYNPKVFRGQVTTLAMYNNQLAIDDMLLNHVILQSQKNDSTKTANKYAAVNPLFAPYQYTKEDGGLWYKAYVDIERLSMTQNLNVNNTAYGSLIGADLPLVHLKNGWDFIPTFFIGYNGSRQSYSDMNMYQNGGQGGFMGTFMKNDFIGSILAYGGGYLNEMNVEGFTDKTGNWFAGTAAKAAYNFHPSKHFIIQPTAMVAYNAFGKQSWGTDYGAMSMNSGMMNGISVAPGMNLIYARDTWSLYATFQYLFNINDHVGGHAGVDVNLPEVRMRHGYIQYGLGATKTFKERLNSYFQFVIRNGGRTGVGFQFGLQYLFDWNNLIGGKQSVEPAKKTVVKETKEKVVPVSDKPQKTKKVKQKKSTDPTKAVKQSKPSDNTKPAVSKSKKSKNTDKVNSNKEIIVTPDGTKRTVIKQLKK